MHLFHKIVLLSALWALAGCDSSTSDENDSSEALSSSVSDQSSSSVSASSTSTGNLQAEENETLDYALERSPKINRQGIGIDFIHDSTTLDTAFLDSGRDYSYDLVLYNVMVYYIGDTGDSTSEGCPAILMYTSDSVSVAAYQVGKGTDFFDSYTTITAEEIDSLKTDPVVDFDSLHYGAESIEKDTLMNAYSQLVIGNKFRATVLEIPDGSTEQEEQPVFLVKTREGGYAKFMVYQFQGSGDDKQKTLVRWQVLVTP
ncbi:MAG TPA: hypothetical protein VLM37_02945 [Fibrobacteraceae bacterium]|nr:hypothetical protein [Fibrobacteraceae bacterium]